MRTLSQLSHAKSAKNAKSVKPVLSPSKGCPSALLAIPPAATQPLIAPFEKASYPSSVAAAWRLCVSQFDGSAGRKASMDWTRAESAEDAENGWFGAAGEALAEAIEARLRTGRLLGAAEWIAAQEAAGGRRLTPGKPGRKLA
jgi:hypothetical protein